MHKKVNQGDIYLVNLSPRSGHEIQETRRVLVVSNNVYNHQLTKSTFIVYPITTTHHNRDFPTRYQLAENPGRKVKGTVLCDQVTCLDFSARNAVFLEHLDDEIELNEIIQIGKDLL